jgi:hypothetical protein
VVISRTASHQASAVASAHLSAATPAIARHAAELGYRDGFGLAVLLMLIPFALCLFVNDRKAKETLENRIAEAPAAAGAGAPAASAPATMSH